MKKLLLFLTVISWSSTSFCNPIELPSVYVNELYFEDNEWTLELAYFDVSEYIPLISIDLSTLSGETQLQALWFLISGSEGLIVVQNDEFLSTPLFINPEGDSISVTWGFELEGDTVYQSTYMHFGNYPNSIVTKPRSGQSIALIPFYTFFNGSIYSKDNSPTLHWENDTIGMMGTLKGTVYDVNLLPVPNEAFLINFWFATSGIGDYAVRAYSNIYNRSGIYHDIPPIEWIDTEIHFTMEPDSVVNYDIYLLEDITVGISEPSGFNAGCFRFFPNPVSKMLSLNYEINYSGNDQNLLIEIKSIASEQIFMYPVATGEGIIALPGEISPGVYFVNLLMGENLLSSGKLVINR